MRDRLIKIVSGFCRYEKCSGKKDVTLCKECENGGKLADHLLANGVIVPICKLGDTIYRIGDNGKIYGDWEITLIQAYPDETLYVDDSDNYFVESDIGKTVFLTREEAERALKGGAE